MRPVDLNTVHAAFAEAARRWPDRPILNVLPETAAIYGTEPGEMGYGQAAERVETLRAAFEAAGYRAGQRVMLLLENRPDFFLHWLALNALGLSVVPVNPDLRAAELEYMAAHAEPALAIAIPPRVEELRAAGQAAGLTLPVCAPGEPLPQAQGGPVFDSDGPDAAREAAMLYTSGTTGRPKGCVLSNTYFLEAGRWYANAGGVCALNEDGERMLTPLPIFHMNAMAYSFMAMIAVGGCLTALDRFHPRSWWASVRESGATCLHYLGVMPSMLMGAPEAPSDRAHAVRFGFGAGVDPKLHAAFERRFGFPLMEAWAMTETGAGSVIAANHEPRRVGQACFGRPGPELDVRVVDDAGQDVAPGTPGELLVRHAGDDPRQGFFTEYWKNPEETAKVWQGGWFHTGDVVRQEPSGDMVFVDRKKNVIRRSGENIAAVEVESVLMRHPAIKAAGVAAVPDEVRGDEVFACLKVETPSEGLAREIVDWALGQIAYYKVPGYVAFVQDLPLTATNKIQRAALKALAAELLDDPATVDTRSLKKRQAA
ncbi:AMP-binding protein [Tranquillimonas alkanivorans]|uniref:Acyl-CoA synthetase (AMP-forming)/AMP-acid ligase II n=1 Tax=Tranquillimonas alkanivorans TaxID=441119 RepID=A0A1I5UUZ2_9RHOB|nr:AMP-binding protein [Tranquillimonas alkanivorans]SFP99030.1 Acyl-CoA synthetase (AMP-forming)/AMP-acid ligase II [Tranquillimonas alkanivorans]